MKRRRRIYSNAAQPAIDLRTLIPNYDPCIEEYALDPKYCIIGVETTTENAQIVLQYNLGYKDVRLDGVLKTANSNGVTYTITIPEPGNHFITFYINSIGSSASLSMQFDMFYLRIGNNNVSGLGNLSSNSGANNRNWGIIDILYPDTLYMVKRNLFNTFSVCTNVRVPVGSKQKYIDYSTPTAVLNKMIEVNYKIN